MSNEMHGSWKPEIINEALSFLPLTSLWPCAGGQGFANPITFPFPIRLARIDSPLFAWALEFQAACALSPQTPYVKRWKQSGPWALTCLVSSGTFHVEGRPGTRAAWCSCHIWLSFLLAWWWMEEKAELAGLAAVWQFYDSQEQVDSRCVSPALGKGSAVLGRRGASSKPRLTQPSAGPAAARRLRPVRLQKIPVIHRLHAVHHVGILVLQHWVSPYYDVAKDWVQGSAQGVHSLRLEEALGQVHK